MKIEFSERVTTTSLTAQVGGSERVFKRSDEPFEVSETEGRELIASGYFRASAAVKVRFKEGVTSPKLDVAQGNYRRSFLKAEQPFEVTPAVFEQHLLPTGLFEVVPETSATERRRRQPPPPTE